METFLKIENIKLWARVGVLDEERELGQLFSLDIFLWSDFEKCTSNDDIKKKREEIIKSVKKVNKGKGVVILTDMFGGTPSNLAISIMEEEKVEVVAGVNLPMLIKISSLRNECEIKELIKVSQESGRKYMNVASAFFGES